MNEHERSRIAAAMNAARPDWPTRQLLTLLADERLADRPRRDVFVALAWVACESGTSSPYRVLEAGPWWKAAGIEGTSTQGRNIWPDDAHRCRTCSLPGGQCRQRWANDHDYEPATKPAEVDIRATVTALRNIKATETPRQEDVDA